MQQADTPSSGIAACELHTTLSAVVAVSCYKMYLYPQYWNQMQHLTVNLHDDDTVRSRTGFIRSSVHGRPCQ